MEEFIKGLKEQRAELIELHSKSFDEGKVMLSLNYAGQIYTLNKVIDLAEILTPKN